jgi:CspA family cold shock protein
MMNRRHPPRVGGGEYRRDVTAVVKWFNPTKGFGFVQVTDGSPDAFLHASVVEQSGHREMYEGTKIVCDIAEGQKGPQVAVIHRVEELGTPPVGGGAGAGGGFRPSRFGDGGGRGGFGGGGGGGFGGPATEVEGTVKFFNAEKGFGFVTPDDGGKDVYVASRALQRAGLPGLNSEQRVRLTVRMGQKGPMAEAVQLL